MARTSQSPITFLLRDPKAVKATPINCVARFKNQRINIGTGKRVTPAHWDFKKERVKNVVAATDKDAVNNTLATIQAIADNLRDTDNLTVDTLKNQIDAYLHPVEEKAAEPAEPPKNALFAFIEDFIEKAPTRINIDSGQHIHHRTIQKYNTTLRVLKEFAEKRKRPVDFDTIDLEFYADFTAYLTKKEKLAMNSVGKYIQTLKVFLNEATAQKVNTKLDYKATRFKVLKEDADSIYLTEQELQMLFTLDLSKNPKLDRVRDLFLVGCYTGLRFSDFTEIRAEYIKDGFIRMEQFKTQGRVVIPCHPVVSAILTKHNNQLPRSISNQKMNDYLKELCQLAGITSKETKGITKAGKRQIQTHEKWELVSTHTGRRSFATNMYLMGIPTLTIMKITGHRTEKAFMKYIKVSEDQHAQVMAVHFEKLLQGSTYKAD